MTKRSSLRLGPRPNSMGPAACSNWRFCFLFVTWMVIIAAASILLVTGRAAVPCRAASLFLGRLRRRGRRRLFHDDLIEQGQVFRGCGGVGRRAFLDDHVLGKDQFFLERLAAL